MPVGDIVGSVDREYIKKNIREIKGIIYIRKIERLSVVY
jgi:hypothetical protein